MPESNLEKTASAPKAKIARGLFIGTGLIILAAFLSLAVSKKVGAPYCSADQKLETKMITSRSIELDVEVAKGSADQVRGLSGRECLQKNTGMLFEYNLSGDYCFWMKDMKFAIDMIWLDDEKKVVTIKENVSPKTYPSTFCPDRPAQYVLEVQAGFARHAGWQTGTEFNW